MDKLIEERIISVNKALNKEWKETFHLTAHREMTNQGEAVAIFEAGGRKVTIFISKEYIFLLMQGVFDFIKMDYQLINNLNIISNHSKYTLDEGSVNAEHNFYTGQYIINAKPKLLTENIRMFLWEVNEHEEKLKQEVENMPLS